MLLDRKVSVITGASRGLGLATAEALLKHGSSVVLCASDQLELAGAASKLKPLCNNSQQIRALRCDITEAEDVHSLVDTTIREMKRVDILVNNAGIPGPVGEFSKLDMTEWIRCINVNLIGTVSVCQAFMPYFKKQGAGKIINLSGGGATAPLPGLSAYAASKAAVVRFTETLSEEVKQYGIDVNAVAPGALDTRLTDNFLAAGKTAIGDALYEKLMYVKQSRETNQSDVDTATECIAFLASSLSDGLSGKLIAAKWDDWSNFRSKIDSLMSTDIFTLRRVIKAN